MASAVSSEYCGCSCHDISTTLFERLRVTTLTGGAGRTGEGEGGEWREEKGRGRRVERGKEEERGEERGEGEREGGKRRREDVSGHTLQ